MLQIIILVLAAIIEVGGDAMIRHGLKERGILFMFLGVVMLAGYGFLVNLTKLNFSRLMGIYIALFFAVSQVISVLVFKERLQAPAIVGGGLIIVGGILMMVWRQV